MKLNVLEILLLEEGLFELGEKEFTVSTSLKINQCLTDLSKVTESIRKTAQPILKKEAAEQEKALQELYLQEMDVTLQSIQLNELSEIKISAKLLEKIQPILEKGVV